MARQCDKDLLINIVHTFIEAKKVLSAVICSLGEQQ